MENIKNCLNRIMRNNSGAALLVVMIVTAFTGMIVAVLMFTSYTNYSMKVTDRASRQIFYDAETAMDEIRAGLQEDVSNAISRAYSEVLINYNESVGDDASAQNSFEQKFLNYMKNSSVISKEFGKIVYSPDELLKYITNDSYIKVSGEGKAEESETDGITLKDITVTCVRDGYESIVKTDLYIKIPAFSYENAEYMLTSLPNYVVVSLDELNNSAAGKIDLSGSVYADSMRFDYAGSGLSILNAKSFICENTISTDNGFILTTDRSSSLWFNRISVGTHSHISLMGDTYVRDDLDLAGNEANATLGGRYFGYGNSAVSAVSSSSIIINGRDTQLNFSDLKSLFIAGNSFVDTHTAASGETPSLLMGESISVKSAQLAYLIPDDLMQSGTNPIMYYTDSVPDDTALSMLKTDGRLWPGTYLSEYVQSEDDVLRVYYSPSGSGQTLVYYYLKFDSPEESANYFTEYFRNNPGKIAGYVSLYSEMMSSVSNVGTAKVKGNSLAYDGTNTSLTGKFGVTDQATTDRLDRMFGNLCTTLSSSNSESGLLFKNIFTFENIKKIGVGDSVSFTSEGKTAAVIINNSAVESTANIMNNYGDSVCLIIAAGDITINNDFNGLVISKGDVTLAHSASADNEAVTRAFTAVRNDQTLLQFLLNTTEEVNEGSDDDSWDPKNMVVYKNWEKN